MTTIITAIKWWFLLSFPFALVFAQLFGFTEQPVRPAVVEAARRGQRQRDDQ